MLDLEIDFSNPEERAAFKKKLIESVTNIIAQLENIALSREGIYLIDVYTAKNNLNKYLSNLQKMTELRDKTVVVEFYRLSGKFVALLSDEISYVEAGFDFPIRDEFIPFSNKLLQLTDRIINYS